MGKYVYRTEKSYVDKLKTRKRLISIKKKILIRIYFFFLAKRDFTIHFTNYVYNQLVTSKSMETF